MGARQQSGSSSLSLSFPFTSLPAAHLPLTSITTCPAAAAQLSSDHTCPTLPPANLSGPERYNSPAHPVRSYYAQCCIHSLNTCVHTQLPRTQPTNRVSAAILTERTELHQACHYPILLATINSPLNSHLNCDKVSSHACSVALCFYLHTSPHLVLYSCCPNWAFGAEDVPSVRRSNRPAAADHIPAGSSRCATTLTLVAIDPFVAIEAANCSAEFDPLSFFPGQHSPI